MPLLRGGRPLKRWRYVGVYGPELMLCAGARAHRPALPQAFWAVLGPRAGALRERTVARAAGASRCADGAARVARPRGRDRPRARAAGERSRSSAATAAPTSGRASSRRGAHGPVTLGGPHAGGRRRAAWSTTPPATTRATPPGAGRPASASRDRRRGGRVEPRRRRARRAARQRAHRLGRRRRRTRSAPVAFADGPRRPCGEPALRRRGRARAPRRPAAHRQRLPPAVRDLHRRAARRRRAGEGYGVMERHRARW